MQPIRSVRFLARQGDFNQMASNNLAHCNQALYPVHGRGTYVIPGAVINYRVEDIYSRPWAAIWEQYFEQGMQRPPKQEDDLFNFK